jgi:hypothetical protein
MRIGLVFAATLIATVSLATLGSAPALAQTGGQSQTTKPDGSSGGHECESKKKEQATS